MKIVISPAKSLDFKKKLPTTEYSQAVFLKEAELLNKELKGKNPSALSKLMGISNELAELNWQRNQKFSIPFTADNARPAVYSFNGDVYKRLDAYSISRDKLGQLQDKLRILSGLYGVLRPLDLIQPYRLEMGTRLKYRGKKNLYEFWKEKLTEYLNSELEDKDLFINLASNEYFDAVDENLLKVPVYTPVFKDWKNDKLKVISFFAKKARGSMVRYIIDTNAKTIDDIKGFNRGGYVFSKAYTTRETSPVFIR